MSSLNEDIHPFVTLLHVIVHICYCTCELPDIPTYIHMYVYICKYVRIRNIIKQYITYTPL